MQKSRLHCNAALCSDNMLGQPPKYWSPSPPEIRTPVQPLSENAKWALPSKAPMSLKALAFIKK